MIYNNGFFGEKTKRKGLGYPSSLLFQSLFLTGDAIFLQRLFHPKDIQPFSRFISGVMENPDLLKTESLVQPDAVFIWQGDAGVSGIKPICFELLEQLGIKSLSDSLPLAALVYIDGELGAVSVSGALPILGGIGIAHNLSLQFADQVGIPLCDFFLFSPEKSL